MNRTIDATAAGILATALLIASSAFAQDSVRKDVLLIDRMEKAAHHATPPNGITKDEVSARFGEPATKVGAVGDPPISRWIYDGFTVYFEYERVIHAVVNRTSETETAPGRS